MINQIKMEISYDSKTYTLKINRDSIPNLIYYIIINVVFINKYEVHYYE